MDEKKPGPDDPWEIGPLQPTTLCILWPQPEPPVLAGVVAALESGFGTSFEVTDESGGDDPEIVFEADLSDAETGKGLNVYCRPPPDIPEAKIADGQPPLKWSVGLDVVLDPDRPVESYAELLRGVAGAFHDAPAVLDATTWMRHSRQRLDALIGHPDLLLPDWTLWTTQAIYPSRGTAGPTWLHTHGLWRCGRVELEMIEVPRDLYPAAGDLINWIGCMLLDLPTPCPGQPFELRQGAPMVLQPWRLVASRLPAGVNGGLDDREKDGGLHTGARAVVCSPVRKGLLGRRWVWPRDEVELVERGEDIVYYRSWKATERAARQARATWPEFAMAFHSLACRPSTPGGGPSATFTAKVGIPTGREPSSREHLWFTVTAIESGRARGELQNDPIYLPALRRWQVVDFDPADVSDWTIYALPRTFRPYQIDDLQAYCAGDRGEAS